MVNNAKISLLPALEGYPTIMAFNRYILTKASPYIVATCGLVSDDGELLSSFSFSVNKEMFPENSESIVRYLSRLKKINPKPTHMHSGIRLPQGGITITNAVIINASFSEDLAEIRLENYSPSTLTYRLQEDENDNRIRCEGIALLRSSLEHHVHLLADIYMNN